MATDVSPLFTIRGNIRTYYASAGVAMAPLLSDGGAQIVVQGLPERSELVKLGQSWGAAIPSGSAFTYVAGLPTARAELSMYNAEAAGGPAYLIDRVWMFDITTGVTGGIRTLVGQIVPAGAVAAGIAGATGAFTDAATVLKHQLSGRATSYGGNAKFAVPAGNAGVTNQWFPLGNSINNASNSGLAPTVCQALEANVYGRLIVPPGAYLNLAGLASTAAGTAIIGLEWHEVILNLG